MSENDVVEEVESQEFLTALLNGQAQSTEKLVKLIDLRFRSLGRRERERHQQLAERLTRLEQTLVDVAAFAAAVRRLGRLLVRGLAVLAGMGGSVGAIAAAILKILGEI